MISKRYVKSFCCEDASKIENYNLAIADNSQVWVIHHRLEIIEHKSREELKKEGRYFKRPACELIYLTKSEHRKLHNIGENNPNFGKFNNHKQSTPVLQFTKDGKFIAEYLSTRGASRQTNIDHSSIVKCCKGKAKYAGGYIWKYKTIEQD